MDCAEDSDWFFAFLVISFLVRHRVRSLVCAIFPG
jgi:hypothetical protein